MISNFFYIAFEIFSIMYALYNQRKGIERICEQQKKNELNVSELKNKFPRPIN